MSKATPENVVILDPSRELQRRTHRADGLTRAEAELRARAVIDSYSEAYEEKLLEDACHLDRLVAANAHPDDIYKMAKEIQGLAGTFGHHAAGEICGVLCHYLERIGADDPLFGQVVRSQADALRLTTQHKQDDIENLDQLLENIREMVAARYDKIKK